MNSFVYLQSKSVVMEHSLPDSNTKKLLQILQLKIDGYDEGFIAKIISKRKTELNINNEKKYLEFLLNDSLEREIFENLLNISYSIFYRNTLTFQILEHLIIPQIMINKKINFKNQISIWSCACASGQEPYTLAMLIEDFKSSRNCSVNYHIFATDISIDQLNKSIHGIYSESMLKNVPLHQFQKWFHQVDNGYALEDSLKNNVSFSKFDLLDQNTMAPPDSIYGDFDIIMCANMLYYYNEESRDQIFKKLILCSNSNTYFIASEVEREYFIQKNFIELFPQSAIFQILN